MIDVSRYIYRLGVLKTVLSTWIDNYPNHIIIESPLMSIPNGHKNCKHGQYKCDRVGVCPFIGTCFFEHEIIKPLPKYMGQQIKNAKSMKQALQLLNTKKYFKNEKF